MVLTVKGRHYFELWLPIMMSLLSNEWSVLWENQRQGGSDWTGGASDLLKLYCDHSPKA